MVFGFRVYGVYRLYRVSRVLGFGFIGHRLGC